MSKLTSKDIKKYLNENVEQANWKRTRKVKDKVTGNDIRTFTNGKETYEVVANSTEILKHYKIKHTIFPAIYFYVPAQDPVPDPDNLLCNPYGLWVFYAPSPLFPTGKWNEIFLDDTPISEKIEEEIILKKLGLYSSSECVLEYSGKRGKVTREELRQMMLDEGFTESVPDDLTKTQEEMMNPWG